MWTRKELKDKAKVSLKANYWKSVLVALVLLTLSFSISVPSSARSSSMGVFATPEALTEMQSVVDVDSGADVGEGTVDVDGDGRAQGNSAADGAGDLVETVDGGDIVFGSITVMAMLALLVAVLMIIALLIALYVFVVSPLEVGCRRFFVRNLNNRADVKEIVFSYDNNYKETVKTVFLRSLFVFLWSLLLVIPGIYKAYEYRMIPYLLADDPTMTKDRAFAESKRMMDGQKWRAFVLDLSFIGWHLLSGLTIGILGVFYVGPYQEQTNAALYERLRYGASAPDQGAQAIPVAPERESGVQQANAPVIVSAAQPPIPPFAASEPQSADRPGATAPMPKSAENNGSADSPHA